MTEPGFSPEWAARMRPPVALRTGQRYSHTTARGEARTVDVLVVQERLEAEPEAVLLFRESGAVFRLAVSVAARWLRLSTLTAGPGQESAPSGVSGVSSSPRGCPRSMALAYSLAAD